MSIYSGGGDFIFDISYKAKQLLDNSVARTLRGDSSIKKGAVITGCGNILLARIESVVAFAFVALSAMFLFLGSAITAPCFLVPAIVLNLASRIPGIASFKAVQNFTRNSSSAIFRTFKVCLMEIPVIFLFLTASGINIFLPGILKSDNIFFKTIHNIVKSLGPLQRIRAVVPNITTVVGTKEKLSILEEAEECLRALSYKNYLKEEEFDLIIHHRSI